MLKKKLYIYLFLISVARYSSEKQEKVSHYFELLGLAKATRNKQPSYSLK
jgi:hypothetical protein